MDTPMYYHKLGSMTERYQRYTPN